MESTLATLEEGFATAFEQLYQNHSRLAVHQTALNESRDRLTKVLSAAFLSPPEQRAFSETSSSRRDIQCAEGLPRPSEASNDAAVGLTRSASDDAEVLLMHSPPVATLAFSSGLRLPPTLPSAFSVPWSTQLSPEQTGFCAAVKLQAQKLDAQTLQYGQDSALRRAKLQLAQLWARVVLPWFRDVVQLRFGELLRERLDSLQRRVARLERRLSLDEAQYTPTVDRPSLRRGAGDDSMGVEEERAHAAEVPHRATEGSPSIDGPLEKEPSGEEDPHCTTVKEDVDGQGAWAAKAPVMPLSWMAKAGSPDVATSPLDVISYHSPRTVAAFWSQYISTASSFGEPGGSSDADLLSETRRPLRHVWHVIVKGLTDCESATGEEGVGGPPHFTFPVEVANVRGEEDATTATALFCRLRALARQCTTLHAHEHAGNGPLAAAMALLLHGVGPGASALRRAATAAAFVQGVPDAGAGPSSVVVASECGATLTAREWQRWCIVGLLYCGMHLCAIPLRCAGVGREGPAGTPASAPQSPLTRPAPLQHPGSSGAGQQEKLDHTKSSSSGIGANEAHAQSTWVCPSYVPRGVCEQRVLQSLDAVFHVLPLLLFTILGCHTSGEKIIWPLSRVSTDQVQTVDNDVSDSVPPASPVELRQQDLVLFARDAFGPHPTSMPVPSTFSSLRTPDGAVYARALRMIALHRCLTCKEQSNWVWQEVLLNAPPWPTRTPRNSGSVCPPAPPSSFQTDTGNVLAVETRLCALRQAEYRTRQHLQSMETHLAMARSTLLAAAQWPDGQAKSPAAAMSAPSD